MNNGLNQSVLFFTAVHLEYTFPNIHLDSTFGIHIDMYYIYIYILQVLDWIENHGEAFLSKHTGVGKSLHRARALQKRHEDFEEVAQVGPVFCFNLDFNSLYLA